jgi:hypothetical protein
MFVHGPHSLNVTLKVGGSTESYGIHCCESSGRALRHTRSKNLGCNALQNVLLKPLTYQFAYYHLHAVSQSSKFPNRQARPRSIGDNFELR